MFYVLLQILYQSSVGLILYETYDALKAKSVSASAYLTYYIVKQLLIDCDLG